MQELSNIACLSTYHFARMFKQATGLSPYQFILKRRLHRASTLLKSGIELKQVIANCGYTNHSRFARAFGKAYAISLLHKNYCQKLLKALVMMTRQPKC